MPRTKLLTITDSVLITGLTTISGGLVLFKTVVNAPASSGLLSINTANGHTRIVATQDCTVSATASLQSGTVTAAQPSIDLRTASGVLKLSSQMTGVNANSLSNGAGIDIPMLAGEYLVVQTNVNYVDSATNTFISVIATKIV